MRLIYGPFEPDKPPFLASGLQVAGNVYRAAVGYRPVGQFTGLASALPSAPVGAAAIVPASATVILSGTATNLYRLNGSAWTSLASGFTATRWNFAQWGSLAIATNGTDAMQKIDTATSAVADVGGSPPTAKILAVVKDFLVAGFTAGVGNQMQWSGINDAEFWTPGLNQCDFQIMPTGGDINGILGGETGIILQRNRVSRMTYVGSNLIFQFDEISANLGCVHSNSVVQAGAMGFWLSDTGFVQWDGAVIAPIGQEVIDRTFAAAYSSADWANMSAAVDMKNNLVAWAMRDRIFVYNWMLHAWSIIEKACPFIFTGFSNTDPLFYAFDSAFELGTFSGSPMEATFGTGDLELAQGREARLSSVRPLCDAIDGISLSFLSRQRQGDQVDENIYDAMEDSGEMPVRESGRYIRIAQTIEASTDWTYCEGLDLAVANGARR